MKPALLALTLTALLAPVLAHAADTQPLSAKQYAEVLKGTWRAPQNVVRDVYRHPQQSLQFFGLRPNQTVIEITPGSGWYSELLAPLLKDHGTYIAAVQAPTVSDSARKNEETLKAKFAVAPAQYAKARVVEFDPKAPVLGKPGSADTVLTFRNVHNWVLADTAPLMFESFFKVLKPGGVLGFGLSDLMKVRFTPDPAEPQKRIHFLHCNNGRHHSLAIFECPMPHGCVHMIVEVNALDEVGRALDRVHANGVKLSATLGQHTNDQMISFYIKTPSGFDLEYGCDGLVVDWDRHTPFESTVVSHWGHDFSVGRQ